VVVCRRRRPFALEALERDPSGDRAHIGAQLAAPRVARERAAAGLIAHDQRDAYPLEDLVVVGDWHSESHEQRTHQRRYAGAQPADRRAVPCEAGRGEIQICGARLETLHPLRETRGELGAERRRLIDPGMSSCAARDQVSERRVLGAGLGTMLTLGTMMQGHQHCYGSVTP